MKKLLFVFVLLLAIKKGYSQNFYETSFKDGYGIKYTGLLIYYDDNDAVMRIKYTKDGVYKVAEYKCKGKYFDKNGLEGYLLNGLNAKIVYGNDGKTNYSADNFIFVKSGDGYGEPAIIDDRSLASSNPKSSTQNVTYWKALDPSTFTEKYVRNFFEKEEPMYNELIAYSQPKVPTSTVLEGSLSGEYLLSDISTGGNKWATTMAKNTKYYAQKWQITANYPRDFIKTYWDAGYYISSLGHKNGDWAVVMSKGTGFTDQSWKTSEAFPKDWIANKWKSGYAITNVSYGDNQWAVVMSKGTGYGIQSWKTFSSFPDEWIKEKWHSNYYITQIGHGNGLWAVVMTKDCGIYQQAWKTNATYPNDWISEHWDDNFHLNSIAHSPNLWGVIMSKGTGYTRQSWKTSTAFPTEWIKEKSGGNLTTTTPTTTSTVASGNAKIHVIMVANTLSNIGPSCRVDQNNVIDEFEDISEALNIPLQTTIVNGRDVTRSGVTNALNKLNPGSNDIVVFAYSGHGYRWSSQTSKYPNLDLRYNDYTEVSNANNYNLQEVYDVIKSKGARLNIVIGDCSNNDIGVTSRSGKPPLAMHSFTEGEKSKLAKLFLEKRGNIIAAAARPYETSCGGITVGGYFTNSFFNMLHKETSKLSNDPPDWNHIFDLTIESANYRTQNLNGYTQQNGMYYSTVN